MQYIFFSQTGLHCTTMVQTEQELPEYMVTNSVISWFNFFTSEVLHGMGGEFPQIFEQSYWHCEMNIYDL